jgi:hypothetical protein
MAIEFEQKKNGRVENSQSQINERKEEKRKKSEKEFVYVHV